MKVKDIVLTQMREAPSDARSGLFLHFGKKLKGKTRGFFLQKLKVCSPAQQVTW